MSFKRLNNKPLKIGDGNKLNSSDNKFYCNIKNDEKLDDDIKDNDKPQSRYKKLDDEIMETMQGQFHTSDSLKDKSIEEITEEDIDKIITPKHKESIRKIKEILDD